MENLAPIDGAADVPTKQYVDDGLSGKSDTGHNHDSDYVAKSGDTMTGDLVMSGSSQRSITYYPTGDPSQDVRLRFAHLDGDMPNAVSGTGMIVDNPSGVPAGATDVHLHVVGGENSGVWVNDWKLSREEWVKSRGSGDLVSNGSLFLQNNYNFSAWNYQPADAAPGARGSIEKPGSTAWWTDELIPVVAGNRYQLKWSLRQVNPGIVARNYFSFICYDTEGLQITYYMYWFFPGSTTTLAQDLNNGDNYIYLTSTDNWVDGSTAHQRTIAFWNYVDGNGRTWPTETYTRWYAANAWDQGTIDRTGHRLVLRDPWSGGSYSAGHPVSNTQSGGTYNYIAPYNVIAPEMWTEYSGFVEGEGKDALNFRPGTAFIRFGALTNRDDTANSNIRWSAMSMRQVTAADGSDHDHDSRYYTETETNNLLAGKEDTGTAAAAVSAHEAAPDPHPQYATDAELSAGLGEKVHKTGDVMTGSLGMSDSVIYNVGAPVSHDHAATKGYVDGEVAKKADTVHTHTESQITDLGSYPDATGVAATQVAQTDGAGGWQFIPTPSGGGSGRTGEWSYNSSVGAVPSNRQYTANSATATAVTQLRFDDNDANGIDHTQVMVRLLTVGSKLLLQDKGNSTIWALYEVTAVPTDAGGYIQVQVAHRDDSGTYPPSNNTNVVVEMVVKSSPSDHGELEGLGDDDHPQYHTDARGDARYYTKSQVDSSLAGKANTTTTITAGNGLSGGGSLAANRTLTVGAGTGITVGSTSVSINRSTVDGWYDPAGSAAARVAKSGDTMTGSLVLPGNPTAALEACPKQYVDSVAGNYLPLTGGTLTGALTGTTITAATVRATSNATGVNDLVRKAQLDGLLAGKADTSHVHSGADITSGTVAIARLPTGTSGTTVALGNHLHDDRYYTETETDALLSGKADSSHTHSATQITSGTLAIARVPTGTTGTTVALGNHLHTGVYDPAGTGAAEAATRVAKSGDTMTGALVLPASNPTTDNQATRKAYVDAEVATRAPTVHTHDDRYYTETETDTKLGSKANTTTSISAGTGLSGGGTLAATRTLSVNRTVTDTWYDASGAASSAVAAHEAKADPHGQYLEPDEVVAGSNITIDTTTTPGSVIISGTAGPVTDHGALSGLADDDHPQYLTNARGDARYDTKGTADTKVAKSGDTMTGALTLPGTNPTADNHAARKKYVDDGLAGKAPLTGGGTSGTWPISITGNAATATTSGSTTGNAATASKLATARTISLTGDVTGSTSFDGSANASITATVADDSHNHIIGNVDGLQTALDGKAPTSHNHSATQITSGTLNIARVPTGTSGTTVALGNHLHTGVYDPAGSAAARVAKAGDTMTGDLTVASNSVVVDSTGTAFIGIDKGAATNYGQLEFRTAGSQTWVVGTDNADDFRIFRAGVGVVLEVDKASGAISITKPLGMGSNQIHDLADPTAGDHATNKDYVDSIVGSSDHGSLGGLADDDHLQYAPIAVVDGADPVPPGTPERAGTLIVRENATGDELGFLQKQGGTMTGPLVLQSDPAAPLEAATKQYIDELLAPIVNVGSWVEAYQSVSGQNQTITASFSSFNVERPGGWTITNGTIRVPWTGNYMMVNRYRIAPAQVQIWVGHQGYPNPVLNMWEAAASETWLTYTYMFRTTAGAGVPNPIIYAAGGNAWDADLIQSVTYMGNV